MTEQYTAEELAALPQTTTVFDVPQLDISAHDWLQQGYHIVDNCNPTRPDCHQGGIPIPTGKTLVKRGGAYDLVDEGSR